jgi:DNA topoisomerase-1
MNLVIVESPTKANTIKNFLDKDFIVTSSYGHVRDLPKSKLGVDVENNFKPHYIVPKKAQKQVTALRKSAAKAKEVILATDEDREGEAIAWHLAEVLKINDKKTKRIVFHEITKEAIKNALKEPRHINQSLVDAQQARRVIDRLVGYKLSPFLWKKIRGGLSAGRVQSVAVRLIVEREEEIKKFKPEEYWTIVALFNPDRKENNFEAALFKLNGKEIGKLDIKTEKEASKISDDLKSAAYKVENISKSEVKRNPLPPFTTSTLQQEASKRLYFSAKKTMFVAQHLYENGLITYMRTDSLNLSKESTIAAKKWITKELGSKYAVDAPRVFKTKSRLAQEAHEAIRPTNPESAPDLIHLAKDEQKLYELIWRRFIASQLPQAKFDATTIEISADSQKNKYILRASGNIIRFDGFMAIWKVNIKEKELPILEDGQTLKLVEITPSQHFTEPLSRYNEASLVKTLEEYGIGRPSTYAPIISVIQTRGYVVKNSARRFEPTETGTLVNKMLSSHFPNIIDVGFTAEMEDSFDSIADGKKEWQEIVKRFYDPFEENLSKKYEEVEKQDLTEKTDMKCEICGKDMLIKHGRFGKFLACSGFPECKNTKNIKDPVQSIGMNCPKCGDGEIVIRRTKRGRMFYGCNKYPACDYASWTNPKDAGEVYP